MVSNQNISVRRKFRKNNRTLSKKNKLGLTRLCLSDMDNLFGTNKANSVAGLMFLSTKLERMKPEKLVEISKKLGSILMYPTLQCLIEHIKLIPSFSKKWIF